VAHPTEGEPAESVPQNPYGALTEPDIEVPAQPYGALPPLSSDVPEQHTGPVPLPAPAPVPVPKAGRGKILAIVGGIVAVVVIGGVIALVAGGGGGTGGGTGTGHVTPTKTAKAANPGCVSAEAHVTVWRTKIQADSSDPDALKVDLGSAVTDFRTDAADSTTATSKAAITKVADDAQELLDDVNAGTPPPPSLEAQFEADNQAVDAACAG
jgi:hypothetical protein